jgi:hypothetical protein
MFLFHKLSEEDQHNAIHYCMHLVVEDMLEEGVQLEPFSEEDKKMRAVLEQVIGEAQNLPEEQQFEYVVHHAEGGQIIFDIALDMARSAYYPSDDELVINYESLRSAEQQPETQALLETFEELTVPTKKGSNSLN